MPVSVTKPFYRSGFDECWRAAFVDVTAEGLSFILLPRDPYLAFDLDDVIAEDATLHSKARELVRALNTYTEISPSGRGLRIFCKVNQPPEPGGRGRKAAWAEGYWQGKALRMQGTRCPARRRRSSGSPNGRSSRCGPRCSRCASPAAMTTMATIDWPDRELHRHPDFRPMAGVVRTQRGRAEADAKLCARWQGSTEGLRIGAARRGISASPTTWPARLHA